MKGMVYKMCFDKQGTHSVQSIIEMMLSPEEEDFLASEIKGHIGELASVSSLYLPNRTSMEHM